jgi:hypothetical protein
MNEELSCWDIINKILYLNRLVSAPSPKVLAMDDVEFDAIKAALKLVKAGHAKRIDVNDKISVYKAGAVTRIDIKD